MSAATDPTIASTILISVPFEVVRIPHRMNEINVEPDAGVRESSKGQPLIVCTTLFSNLSWRWFAPLFGKALLGVFRGNPRNWLERTIQRPALAQWRACWESIRIAA